MEDEFDRAIAEALNEIVPPVAISPGLADRLVARARRRSRSRKLLFAFFAASMALGAVWTASELAGTGTAGGDDSKHETADSVLGDGMPITSGTNETMSTKSIDNATQDISTDAKGETEMQASTILARSVERGRRISSLLAVGGMVLTGNAIGGTTYTWTGGAGLENGAYRWGNPYNWSGTVVPASGDDVILDFGTISSSITLTNDIVGLRIRGFNLNCPGVTVTMRGEKLTLVGTGGGTSSPDSIRSGKIFQCYMPLEIVGDYTFKSGDDRTHLYGPVSSDASAVFSMAGGTFNLYGDWSGFMGRRRTETVVCFGTEAAAPAAVPLYIAAPSGSGVFFALASTSGHSPLVFESTVATGRTMFTVEGNNGYWDGDFTPLLNASASLELTWTLNNNMLFTFTGNFLSADGMVLNVNAKSGAVLTLGGNTPLTARSIVLLAPGRLRIARPLNLTDHVVKCYLGGTVQMGCTDALAGNTFLFTGGSVSAACGTLDLNGFNQTIPDLAYSYRLPTGFTGYSITSASSATLTITNNSPICAVVKGKAIVCAKGCTLTAYPEAVAESTGIFKAVEGGVLDFSSCTSVGSGANLMLSDGGAIRVPSGVTLEFEQIRIDGTPKAANTYDSSSLPGCIVGGGSIRALTDGSVEEEGTYTWKGGTDGNTLASAANWNEGMPDFLSGSSALDFSSGTSQAMVSGTPYAYRLAFSVENPFVLGAVPGGTLKLFNGGIVVSGGEHLISSPLSIGFAPQPWSITSGAKLTVSGDISSPGLTGAVVTDGTGTLELSGDNSGFSAPFILSNGTHVVISSNTGLGSAGRMTELHSPEANATSSSQVYLKFTNVCECLTPIGLIGATGPIVDANGSIAFSSLFSCLSAGDTLRTCSLSVPANATISFSGGISCGSVYRFFLNLAEGASAVVTNMPISGWTGTPDSAEIDIYNAMPGAASDGTLRLNVSGNDWRTLRVLRGTVCCGATNALARDGWVLFGRTDWTPGSGARGHTLDLGGYDQLTCGASTAWRFKAGSSTYNPANYAVVKSDTPAVLTMSPTTAYNSYEDALYGALKFSGHAGLRFAPPSEGGTNAFSIAYQVSDTKGTLEVTSGTLSFVRGAGWGGSSNVVVSGTGTLRIDAESTDNAFGSNGGDTCLYLSENGKIDIPAGHVVVVSSVSFGGHYVRSGTYGSAGSGADNERFASYFTSGGGMLRSRKSLKPGFVISFK